MANEGHQTNEPYVVFSHSRHKSGYRRMGKQKCQNHSLKTSKCNKTIHFCVFEINDKTIKNEKFITATMLAT